MKLKTEDGKYFSELGSWGLLLKAFIFVFVYKIFGLLIGVFVLIFIAGIFALYAHKNSILVFLKKFFRFLFNNWFPVSVVVLIVFSIYWFGVRPVFIRKNCAVVRWTQSATLEVPASENWPKCQGINPFDSKELKNSNFFDSLIPIQGACYPSTPAKPETTGERKATDNEYKACLRAGGI